ncbi:MAG: phospholipid carrier-dependent glycosyltransferase [Anaerolineae bacterium]|nr:phospholipid carrier-dependent glycosyltransferase [Anaerolineae bacterium]
MKDKTIRPKWILLVDVLLLALLACYVLMGVKKVPFHGDESTIIWMSADYDTVVLRGDISAVAYTPPPRRTTEQHLRILNGTWTRWTMGIAWSAAGFHRADLNDQWVWGLDPEWNRDNGHLPSGRLLNVTRLSSALFLIFSMALVLRMTRLVASQVFTHPLIAASAGRLSAILYALNPVILMNGRRAMFEGAMLFTLALVGWMVLRLVNRQDAFKSYLLLGGAAGIALIAKHSTVFTIAVLFLGLLVVKWVKSDNKSKRVYQLIFKFGLAAITALIVFLALTPLWWSRHLMDMPGVVLDERQKLLDEQVILFGGYNNLGERLEGLWEGTFGVEPQYYEADYWGDYAGVADEIDDYESSHLAGIKSPIIVGIRICLAIAGLVAIGFGWRHGQKEMAFVLFIWAIGIIAVSLLTIPLDWQRYYLPIQTPLSLVMGLGGAMLLQIILNHGD